MCILKSAEGLAGKRIAKIKRSGIRMHRDSTDRSTRQILDGNDVGLDGTKALSETLLKNASLKSLSLRRNFLLADAAQVRVPEFFVFLTISPLPRLGSCRRTLNEQREREIECGR